MDLWFFDRETISAAERFCDDIASRTSPEQKDSIIRIKKDLIERKLYSFDQYRSIDVYHAVLDNNVKNADEFLALFSK